MAAQDSNDSATIEDLKKQIAALRSDLGDVTKTLQQVAEGEVKGAAKQAKAKAARMSEKARSAATYARDEADEVVNSTKQMIAERPLMAAGIAVAVGYLLGVMHKRR